MSENTYPYFNHSMGGKSIMFWGLFCSKSVLNLHECEVQMNSDKYVALLKENIILFAKEKYDNLHIYQQDNATIHVSHKTRAFMREAGVAIMKWQACSLDLN